ncbi:class I SAM-dependent methyltransferase [Pseudalkalibacillus sp. SCS-8]|uniref:class I SAM-dependent methyltransferase n=1 Tax=Pseudalkalibacillus nanhaiensis TaxID=3115291 RepID=UPI0032DB831C
MIITTGGKARSHLRSRARELGMELGIKYIERSNQSIEKLLEMTGEGIVVVEKERIKLYAQSDEDPIFFHPNSSMFRIKRLQKGEDDPLIRNTGLQEGMSFLDCTLGWASDSIVAAYVVGEGGKVVGIEGSPTISLLTKIGLKLYQHENWNMVQAMRSIDVQEGNHLPYLEKLETDSFDVVYFDPMFEESILSSDGINPLKKHAIYETMTEKGIEEAKRVARKRVVLKDHWKSKRFERFGFKVEKRKTSAFHFGHIDLVSDTSDKDC